MTPVAPEDLEATLSQLRSARNVLVKIGSNVLVGSGPAPLDFSVFGPLIAGVAELDGVDGHHVTLVTSGALAVARRTLGMPKPAGGEALSAKQALASVGQPILMGLYEAEFRHYGKQVAQVLVSPENLGDRERFINARNTLRALGELPKVFPIINENDTTSTIELRFGDNDNLAAQCIQLVDADVLIILSDVDGLYDADPSRVPTAKRFRAVYADDEALAALAEPPDPNGPGSGGMATKLMAAKIAGANGVPTVVAPGRAPEVLRRVLAGEDIGTVFVPGERQPARKTWLRFASRAEGALRIDAGACNALLHHGKSLLAVGIVAVEGEFRTGDAVEIVGPDDVTIARGLANYSSREIEKIVGCASSEISERLGFHDGDAVVHRDDLAVVEVVS